MTFEGLHRLWELRGKNTRLNVVVILAGVKDSGLMLVAAAFEWEDSGVRRTSRMIIAAATMWFPKPSLYPEKGKVLVKSKNA